MLNIVLIVIILCVFEKQISGILQYMKAKENILI